MSSIETLKIGEIDAARQRVTLEYKLATKRLNDVYAKADAHRKALTAACETGMALAATLASTPNVFRGYNRCQSPHRLPNLFFMLFCFCICNLLL